MNKLSKILSAVSIGLAAAGCDSVPSYVIQPEEMSQLLADLYTAEAIADVNRQQYATDSMKKALKQSIYLRHGVTAEEVDTSFVWYGHNIERYIAVHDRVMEILQKDLSTATGKLAAIGVEGDSVDTWQWSRHYAITPTSPSKIISFDLPKDENWERGDQYTWNIKVVSQKGAASWGLTARYPDGSCESVSGQITGLGWTKLHFLSDSTRMPERITGYIFTAPGQREKIFIDSVSLIRDRVSPEAYYKRYRQYKFHVHNTVDSLSAK